MVDVDDCCNAAKHLAQEGKADEQRLCISGGSAGGYTTLACLAFRCAALLTLASHCLPKDACACCVGSMQALVQMVCKDSLPISGVWMSLCKWNSAW